MNEAIGNRYDRSAEVAQMAGRYIAWKFARTFASKTWKEVAPKRMARNGQTFNARQVRRSDRSACTATNDANLLNANGHRLIFRYARWRCIDCNGTGASKSSISGRRCTGEVSLAKPHMLKVTAGVLWCWRCGVYSVKRAVGINRECSPKQRIPTQLKRLREGKHPKPGISLGNLANTRWRCRCTRCCAGEGSDA